MTTCPRCGVTHPLGIKDCEAACVAPRRDPLLGSVLNDRYEIQSLVGIGGMGRVYAALDIDLERRVAIKVLAQHLASDSIFVSRFKREVRASAASEHPNIVQVFDFGITSDGRPFMTMELLEGCDLAEELKKQKQLPIDRSVDICGQALFALSAAHAAGIVHRDLKPGNIFLMPRATSAWHDVRPTSRRSRDHVKVLDFGLSRFVSSDQSITELTKTGVTMGTAGYMAPEQIREQGKVDSRADLYSIGVILFYCVTGQKPFAGGNLFNLLTRVLEEPPPSPLSLNPFLPHEFDVLVRRALAKNPDERFQSAEEFISALIPFQTENSGNSTDEETANKDYGVPNNLTSSSSSSDESTSELDVERLPTVFGDDSEMLPTEIDHVNPLLEAEAAKKASPGPPPSAAGYQQDFLSCDTLKDSAFGQKFDSNSEDAVAPDMPADTPPPSTDHANRKRRFARLPRWLLLTVLFISALGLGLLLSYVLWGLNLT